MSVDPRAIEAVEAALAKMTAAPWQYGGDTHDPWGMVRGPDRYPVANTCMSARLKEDRISGWPTPDQPEIIGNGEGIVALRNHAPALLEHLERLEAEVAALRADNEELRGAATKALWDFDEIINPMMREMGTHEFTLTPADLRAALGKGET